MDKELRGSLAESPNPEWQKLGMVSRSRWYVLQKDCQGMNQWWVTGRTFLKTALPSSLRDRTTGSLRPLPTLRQQQDTVSHHLLDPTEGICREWGIFLIFASLLNTGFLDSNFHAIEHNLRRKSRTNRFVDTFYYDSGHRFRINNLI